jgi:hypothetical protein
VKIYDLYGVKGQDLEAARRAVEVALGIRFVPHESSYLGDYYRLGSDGGENFILQSNYDSLEKEWAESAHSDWPFLLYVSESERVEAVETALTAHGVALLRRERL